jgi:DNA adenine methylase
MKKRPSGDYVHEFASEDDRRRLSEALHASRAMVLLSGYHSPLYDELYGDWFAPSERCSGASRTEVPDRSRTPWRSSGRTVQRRHTLRSTSPP